MSTLQLEPTTDPAEIVRIPRGSSQTEIKATNEDTSPNTPSGDEPRLSSVEAIDLKSIAKQAAAESANKLKNKPIWIIVYDYVTGRDYNLWIMTFAFVLLFFAYPIQGVQTIRYPDTGSYILLVLYAAYGVTSLFAAPVIDLVGPEFCMPMGALTYALWIASEFSGSNALVLCGAAAFGWGAGLMWPAAGNILATISTPHNRGSNNGIFQMGFHLGVFSGGLTLVGVINAFTNYDDQYAVFLGLCCASLITFIIFIFTFRARYRQKKPAASTAAATTNTGVASDRVGANGERLYRVVLDDGSVIYRAQIDETIVRDADIVVADLALTGGRAAGAPSPYSSWSGFRKRMFESVEFFTHPIFGPCVLVIISIGGINQGWFNASFNILANHAGSVWVGWIYAISESFGIVAAISFGLIFDYYRKNYQPHTYKYLMHYAFIGVYCMCGTAMGTAYLYEKELGDGPGQVTPSHYYAILIVTCFFYNTSWLAMEISVYTYLTTFCVYYADVAFSAKICCEAIGYMISYGLATVLGPRDMIIMLFAAHFPAAIAYYLWFKAPPTTAPVLKAKDQRKKADEELALSTATNRV